MRQPTQSGQFDITPEQRAELLRAENDPVKRTRQRILALGVLLTPITLAGALFGFKRSYKRFFEQQEASPEFYPLRPISRYAMRLYAGIAWLITLAIIAGFFLLVWLFHASPLKLIIPLAAYLGLNLLISLGVMAPYLSWQKSVKNALNNQSKFGTARFAFGDDLAAQKEMDGLYIGGDFAWSDKGHILTVAGTRGGKGVNLIIPNLLNITNYKGSWLVIDPKGENAAITARYQRSIGRKVVILNPWGLFGDDKEVCHNIGEAATFNPLDILADKSSIHLADDAQILAEMIVPIEAGPVEKFFTDSARSIIAGFILHMMVEHKVEDKSLATLWRWIRYSGDDWSNLLADMHTSQDPIHGDVIKNAASEIDKLEKAGDKTFGSVIGSALQATDFLKSQALQQSLKSGFSPYELADGNTAVYVIIPADKLKSHGRWLRLVVTSCLRAAIRRPNKRITFLLDEFAALGYLPEIEIALSTYAGYEVTIWPILQSLIQLQGIYEKSWETFIANCTIRQFFTINDNFTAKYLSEAFGVTTRFSFNTKFSGQSELETTPRPLLQPDEIRRGSGPNIFAFFGQNPPTYFSKMPYYQDEELKRRADKNPYFKSN